MSKRVGVLLSGCGFLDGAEIHESVLTLLHLDRAGAEIVCIAPNIQQTDVVDHATKKPVKGEKRNVLRESARIARGNVKDLADVDVEDLDALILPGGFGAAKNLSDFAAKGADAKPDADVARLMRAMHESGKPIGVCCIAPTVCAAVFRGSDVHPTLTIGDDAATAKAIEAMGAHHLSTPVTGIAVDDENKIVSTPAFMYSARFSEVSTGIEKLVAKVLSMA